MYYYIVNPNSGDRSYESIKSRLKTKLRQLDIDGRFEKTLDAEDAAKITRSAVEQGAQTIVVVGGDKTVNEVMTALHQSGKTSTSIGIVPTGHHNLLANSIGIHDWQQACELLATRRLRSFQIMDINDHSFIHNCTLTADTPSPLEALIEVDGEYRLRGPLLHCDISNTKLHHPDIDNNLLMNLYSRMERPSKIQQLFGGQSQFDSLSQIHARVITLELTDGEATAIIDGRTIKDSHFRIRLLQKPVHIISARQQEHQL